MYPPPMMMPPPGFFKPRRSFARVFFTTLASALLGLSITLNFLFLLSGGLTSFGHSESVSRTVLVDGDPNQTIAVVPVSGVIMNGTADRVSELVGAAEKDKAVKALVIEVETPGGAVTPSDEIYARIKRFKDLTHKPVVVSMGGLATSGGYYVSCAGDYIICQRTTLTGNIGVILPRYNMSKLAKSYGVDEVTVTAPANGFKNAGSMFAPIKPEETQYLQTLIDEAYGNFTSVVATGRKNKLTRKIEEIANGKVYTASEAMQLGLVDAVGYPLDAYDKAAQMAGLSNKYVVKYSKPAGLFDLFAGGDAKSNVSTKADGQGGMTINGINVNVDANLFDELSRPRLLYLWRGQ
jgi:protease-4